MNTNKKLYLGTIAAMIAAAMPTLASTYVVKVPMNVVVGEWLEPVESYTEWMNDGDEINCSFDIVPNDVYYNQTKQQTQTCHQNQKRTKTVVRENTLGDINTQSSIESRTIENQYINSIVGIHYEESCKNALSFDSSLKSGSYDLKLNNGSYYTAYCDMVTDGGGWTRIDKTAMTNTTNFAMISKVNSGLFYTSGNHYITGHVANGSGTTSKSDARIDIDLNFNYRQFWFDNYSVADFTTVSGHTFDIMTSYINLPWSTKISDSSFANIASGDVVFGTVSASLPTTSYVSEGLSYSSYRGVFAFVSNKIFSNPVNSTRFSIRAGEYGSQDERLSLWNGGYIYFR